MNSSCVSSPSTNSYRTNDDSKPIVDEKYKLTADRQAFDEQRSQIPAEKKIENDEIAFILNLMQDPSREPSKIREKFDSALSKKREKFSKDIQRERDEFTKTEHRNRDEFMKQMDSERKEFLKAKHTKEERDDFFGKTEEKRKDYFENQRERRNDFESSVTERRKDFEDYARGKSAEFLQEYRAFQRSHDEFVKNKEKEKKEAEAARSAGKLNSAGGVSTNGGAAKQPDPEVKSFLQEFMDIPSAPGTTLESGE